MDLLNDILDGKIDFKGQRLADQIIQFSLIIFAIVSFLIGYVNQDLSMTALLMGVGILLTVLVVVPPWPYFRQNPVAWLPAQNLKP